MPIAGPTRIGILAYERCFASEIFGFADLLHIANVVAQQLGVASTDLFRVTVVGAAAGPVRTAGGFEINVTRWHRRLDALVIPGFELVPAEDVAKRLGAWGREQSFIASVADRAIPVASVCVGAFLLGEAGVLDGRQATTAWLFAPQLAARYPAVTVLPDSMIVSDDHVTTTAAFSATLDLAMLLIRRYAGDEVARLTARVTLVADNRTTQAPYVDQAALAAAIASFSMGVERWLVERLGEPYDLGALAKAFNVSTRTMLRRFAAETGRSPLDFLQQVRVDTAKRLLESTDATVADVMERVGYLDPGSFRRLFADQVGVTPATYRRQFRSPVT